jgi:hypothetical protein
VPVSTVTLGSNAALIASAASLYLTPGNLVADVTYGTGRFWKKTAVSSYKFLPSDIVAPNCIRADFRKLPYACNTIDAVIFDPPYIHAPGKGLLADRYNGKQTTDLASYADIMNLYKDGMCEANRVLRKGGQLWVKCKDTLASDRQRWSHISVYDEAVALGMYARDLFILIPPSPPSMNGNRWTRQLHARKAHSYLWIFETGGYRKRG